MMKHTLTLLICLVCCLCMICACGKDSVDPPNTDTDTPVNTDTSTDTGTDPADPSSDTDETDGTDTDYPYITPGTYVPAETDDPNVRIDISPADEEDKWGKINIKAD